MIEDPTGLVEVTVKLPRAVIEFYKAVFAFEQRDIGELAEYLGDEICKQLDAHFDSNLDSLIDVEAVLSNYGLKQVQGFHARP